MDPSTIQVNCSSLTSLNIQRKKSIKVLKQFFKHYNKPFQENIQIFVNELILFLIQVPCSPSYTWEEEQQSICRRKPYIRDTGGYRRIQEDTGGYRRIQEDTGGYRRIKEGTGGYRRIQEDTGGYGMIQEETGGAGGYRRIQEDTG